MKRHGQMSEKESASRKILSTFELWPDTAQAHSLTKLFFSLFICTFCFSLLFHLFWFNQIQLCIDIIRCASASPCHVCVWNSHVYFSVITVVWVFHPSIEFVVINALLVVVACLSFFCFSVRKSYNTVKSHTCNIHKLLSSLHGKQWETVFISM